ncbi:MAG: metal ABC transporter substrate-binding protein [Pseudanabaena sp.]|nr:MAG: metal ABC transporter substrate-binding protein [Pseudanabaena sp.]
MLLEKLAKSVLALDLSKHRGLSRFSVATLAAIATSLGACSVTSDTNSPVSSTAQTPTSSPVAKTENLPLVVATNSVACGLAEQIAGNTINLKCLIAAGTDPHIYQPNPDDRKAIDSAQLILYGGYDFEPSLIKLIQASSNPAPKIAINEVAVPNPIMTADGHSHSHEGDHDHDKDEKKSEGETKAADPHVWNDAENGIKITQSISKSLSELRPDQAAMYSTNTAKLVDELTQIDAWIKTQIATIPEGSRKLITTHDALGYYAQAYGITIEGALNGLSTDEQPTPTRVKELVDVIKSSQVPTIFAEVSINPKLINTVAKEANVKVSERELYADGLGAQGSEAATYAGMLIANTRTIVEGLGGKFTPFQPKN